MNRSFLFAAALLWMGSTGLALAQDATPVPGNRHHSGRVQNPQVKAIMDRITLQKGRIDVGVKNGKLTADQASALNAALKSIYDEIHADFKQNREAGQKGLTEAQITQLNQELDANSTAIHDGK